MGQDAQAGGISQPIGFVDPSCPVVHFQEKLVTQISRLLERGVLVDKSLAQAFGEVLIELG